MMNNLSTVATRMRCEVALVKRLIERGLLSADTNGNVRLDHAEQFLRQNSMMSKLQRLRKELAQEREQKAQQQTEEREKKMDIVERIEFAKADGNLELAVKLYEQLTHLNLED